VTIRGQRVEVSIERASVTYTLAQGKGLTIWHHDEELKLSEGKAVTKQL
jgi:alpha,alpha-trehalose phosphorylase